MFSPCIICELCKECQGCFLSLQEHIDDVQKSVIEHESYKETYHQCMDKATAVKQNLHQLADLSGGMDEVKKKLEKLKVCTSVP